jgi:hypothetical protein
MYDILSSKFFIMSILALNKILTEKVLLVTVAIKTSTKNTWLSYQAIIPITDLVKQKNAIDKIKPGALQAVADLGTKLPEDLARVMFPQFSKWEYVKTDKRHKCRKCKSMRNEIYLKQIRNKWECKGSCNVGGRGFLVKKVTQMYIPSMEETKKARAVLLPLNRDPISYPTDISLDELTDCIVTLTKILHSRTSKGILK